MPVPDPRPPGAAPIAAMQDTAVVMVARDGLGVFSEVATGLLLLVLALLLVGLWLVLVELRRLTNSWTGFLDDAKTRTQPIVEHATSAVQNLDHLTSLIRDDSGRIASAAGALAKGVEEASAELRRRLKDLLALAELAQSEAEEAVVEAAARARVLRAGAAKLLGLARGGAARSADGAPEQGPEPVRTAESGPEPTSGASPDGRDAERAVGRDADPATSANRNAEPTPRPADRDSAPATADAPDQK